MSKESNLRLLGSPVNLSYRGKKKDDSKKITKNRPRSALQNSCFTPDIQERYKRPFSADAKERVQSTRGFLRTYSAERLLYNNPLTVKVLSPTTELLASTKLQRETIKKDKELCSNASDYGSEDTFVSLGTKIKAKAQTGPKSRSLSPKNFMKFKNKRGRKPMENSNNEDKNTHEYGLAVKITERSIHSPDGNNEGFQEHFAPSFKNRSYESYFISLDDKKIDKDNLAGRVSFSSDNIQAEVEQAIDTYARRLTMTKQQLSLVEEETTQDLESVPSQNLSSLSPEISLNDNKNDKDVNTDENLTGRNTYVLYEKGDKITNLNRIGEARTYTSFYDDFRTAPFKSNMSSTVIHNDVASKDSGYPDSGTNDEKADRVFSLSPTSMCKSKSQSQELSVKQPQSLDNDSGSMTNEKQHFTSKSLDKKWTEPLNHSRLLYKDFFLKKEGHIALPPRNSPRVSDVVNIPGTNPDTTVAYVTQEANNLAYPSYLRNSTTKAYTSKVIEDYRRELEAINSLHELTLKDIKTDAISPTPFNIDKMFDMNSAEKQDVSDNSQENSVSNKSGNKFTVSAKNRKDISKVSTKELIQNYLKVKENDFGLPKPPKKFEKKPSNVAPKIETRFKQDWNNKIPPTNTKGSPLNVRNKTQYKNMFTVKTPLSARIASVQNDKDIDSWMSMSTSPQLPNVNPEFPEEKPGEPATESPNHKSKDEKTDLPSTKSSPVANDVLNPSEGFERPSPPKELNSNSTVLDIYSMLKEIESFGDNPVTTVSSVVPVDEGTEKKVEERPMTPKDNFMEIFEFLEKVEQSANDALSVVTNSTPQTTPKLETLLKLPPTELAQRLVTAALQLEERSCCIALLQESLANHKEQMYKKVGELEKQSHRSVSRVKQECEEAIKRHQSFIDQLINDKKTLNHRIEQLVDERRTAEERWRRAAQAQDERHQLQLRNERDKMAAAHQVARQRWVRQKAEKIKELTVKGLEGELREMAERQQQELADARLSAAEAAARAQARHAGDLDRLRRTMEQERDDALMKERQIAASRMEKQILELEVSAQEARGRLLAELRADGERAAADLDRREQMQKEQAEKWAKEQDKLLEEKKAALDNELAIQKEKIEEQFKEKQIELEQKFEQYKKDFEAEQQMLLKKKVTEITAQHKLERDKEIEKAIECMELEAQAGRKELQEALRRNKEQYETELNELGETEKATLRRYQDAQARVRQTEDRCAELEVNVSQLETRNRLLAEKNSQLECRAEEIRAGCEQAWRGRLDALTKEMETMRTTHDEQMHQLYAKVKVAVARKDSAIQALTREAGKYQEKITTLEQKLQQQRKDFLKQK